MRTGPGDARSYSFGSYELDEAMGELRRAGSRVSLRRQSFLLLAYLIRERPRPVSRAELLREVWAGAHVDAATVRDTVLDARKALSGDPGSVWIENVRGLGYRFCGEAKEARAPRRSDVADPAASRPFIDRHDEMAELRSACRAVLDGERRIVLLQGPPGIGKTRTATELARDAAALGFGVHWSRTHEGGGAPPLWPWIQILESWVEQHGPGALDELGEGRGFRLLAPLLEPPAEAEARSRLALSREDERRFQLFDEMRRFLRGAALRRSLLLIFDDLHLGDSSSIELLAFAAQHLLRARILVVATHRPVDPGHPLGRVLHESGARSLVLSGLTRASVEGILAQTLGEDAASELVTQIHERSGGNPFFVDQLMRALARAPAAERAGSRIPLALHDAVWARISGCSEPCRRLLQCASLMGRELTLPVLCGALGLEEAAALEVLAEAERNDLLDTRGSEYRFVHGLVREVLVERMSTAERCALHVRVGTALEAHTGHDRIWCLTELAHHFSESGSAACAERALLFARRAADAARHAFAYREAVDLYRRALRALDLLGRADPAQRSALLVDLGEALTWAGAPKAEFQAPFLEAIDVARAADLVYWVAEAAQRCTHLLGLTGNLVPWVEDTQIHTERFRAALEQVHHAPEIEGDRALHAEVLTALLTLRSRDPRENTSALLEQALELARADDQAIPWPLLTLRHEAAQKNPAASRAERTEAANRLLEFAARSGDWLPRLHGHVVAAAMALEAGERDAFDRAIDAFGGQTRGNVPVEYMSAVFRALQAQLDGPLAAAMARIQAALRHGTRTTIATTGVWGAFTGSAGWMGILGGASAGMLPQVQAPPAVFGGHGRDWFWRLARARLYVEVDRFEDARQELQGIDRRLEEVQADLNGMLFLGVVAADTAWRARDLESAERLHERLHPHLDRTPTLGCLAACMGPVARPVAALSALLGRFEEAEELFARAASHARGLRAPVLEVLTDVDRVQAFAAHPRAAERRESERLRISARTRAHDLGLLGLVRRLDQGAS